jgi:hypothetical protein
MIASNELRLNNWVKYHGEFYKIESLTRDFPFLNTIEFGAKVVEYTDLQPVQLTEDILLNCGFECEYKSEFHSVYFKDGISYYFWYNEKRQYVNFAGAHIKCDYLHNLQNLVHSLKGEELKIEL